jgi:poly(3-hydroxybutyrate) depolymerase
MVEKMRVEHGTDITRTFVTGLSAGGAMTAVMLAAYPDMFRAGAIIAGVPYGCASAGHNVFLAGYKFWYVLLWGEALWASWHCGIDRTHNLRAPPTPRSPEDWRDLLKEAEGPSPVEWPKVSLWHGRDDDTVHPDNLNELVEQWTAAHGIDQSPDGEATTSTYKHLLYKGPGGDVKVEAFDFPVLGHAVPTDPGVGANKCGQSDPAKHFADRDVCAAASIARFWGLGP